MSRGQIIIVPAFEPGRGGGHLARCISLTNELRSMGRGAWLYLPQNSKNAENFFSSMNFNSEWRITKNDLSRIRSGIVDFVVLDFFKTPKEDIFFWKEMAAVIGIDEGFSYRDNFDFLVDILVPEKSGIPPANITSPSLLNFPPRSVSHKQSSNETIKILISFGHEDPAGLGLAVSRSLGSGKDNGALTGGAEITLLKGNLANEQNETLPNVRVINAIPRLSEHLAEYDVVITHYGITAYEALYAGTAVLLVNPTAHHEKSSKAAGFKTLKPKNVRVNFFTKPEIEKLQKYCLSLAAKLGLDRETANLAALVNGFSPQINRHCPVCGKDTYLHNSVGRFNERTYRLCHYCGIIFMDRTCPAPVEYSKEYFFDFYKKQYGKTYIEDFPHLIAMAKKRINIIKSLLASGKTIDGEPLLFDIGCAYGAFMAAAKEEGFSPFGIDPAEDAVNYVKQTLNIPAIHGFFPITNEDIPASFDIITLWFVIEHFRDCVSVLAEIKKTLKPGGILAFSTPSFSGISGRTSLKHFLERSPADHYTVWSPKMCVKALAQAGFTVKKIVTTGHHPERFPLLGKFAKSRKSPLYWLFLLASRIFDFGDTFEVYAVRD